MPKTRCFLALCLLLLIARPLTAQTTGPGVTPPTAPPNATPAPPPPMREFRGVWVATVANIDWPSRPGLTTEQQQAEMRALLDRAVMLHLNAVVLQVRPSADALYLSPLEPWSEYLSGRMGQAPFPPYDPLAFAVAEAHKRGLELHAWFNPFRARHSEAHSAPSFSHVSRTHPEWVKTYGKQLWLDPGEPAARDYSLAVILDVVRRYDIDGVHIDDYFYPYPEPDAHGRPLPFPDDPSWRRYRHLGGSRSRADWRRANIDGFIARLYSGVKQLKPWVKVGISPFGIYRPGDPPQIRGFDAYASLYADSRKWLSEGWLDYLSPQLYWKIEQTPQSFPVLLQWWAAQNRLHRHLWPGLDASRVRAARGAWSPDEIAYQIRTTRGVAGATGDVLYSMSALRANSGGLADTLTGDVYAQLALVPASPWLDGPPPAPPAVAVGADPVTGARTLTWRSGNATPVWLWVVQTHAGSVWTTRILPGDRAALSLPASTPASDAVAVCAVDRCGIQSAPALLRLAPAAP